ncbi:NAD-dependent histone deacetylase SIR2 [Paramyrothecium foliicola]|nr:NAD-dependent histone deacetylase SIR2 [Paramyrothecium foliicola]
MDTSSPLSSLPGSSNSSPLSNFSQTPSLPSSPSPSPSQSFSTSSHDPAKRYPSPMSITASGTQSPMKLSEPMSDNDPRLAADHTGPPPAKRRRIAPPSKERTTEYLDLTKPEDEMDDEEKNQLERLVTALRKKKKVVVIAGAGISVSAGIPDFRSSTGLFATTRTQHKLKASGKHLFDASVYKHDSSTQSFHTMVRGMDQMTKAAKPTPFHHLLASLAHEGRLLRLYSQNIDCIDTRMAPLATKVPLNTKGPWPATIQLHGGLEMMVCTKCGELKDFDGEVFNGPEAPLCNACVVIDQVRTAHAGKRSHGIGRLRPRFVLYNEYNPDEEAIGNVSSADLKARPDAVIVVGTSLKIPGTRRLVKELCQVTRGRRDGFTAWINIESEPKGIEFKDCWDLVVKAKCDDVAGVVALPPWDCAIGNDYQVSNADGTEPSQNSRVEVHIATKFHQVEDDAGIPTPRASPKLSPSKKPVKTKQTKISFGNPSGAASQKVSKSRPRKSKQAVKSEPQKKNLLGSFRAVKNVSDRDVVKKNGTIEAKPIILGDAASFASLPALRPPRRASSESFVYISGSPDGTPPKAGVV